jgi:hypothetical protein
MTASQNVQDVPLARSLPALIKGLAQRGAQLAPLELPCHVVAVSGPFVTVQFDVTGVQLPQITVPQAISRYARPPTQIGDKGFCTSCQVSILGATGKGGIADILQIESNLATLIYVPLSNTAWPAVDANAFFITGPNGARIQDDSSASYITVQPGAINLISNGHTLTIDGSGFHFDGRSWLGHQHTGVANGPNNTGGVV